MASIVEISNVALIGLGENPISALTEQSTPAIAVNAHWNTVRRSLLRRHTWNFAIKRVDLARSTTPPNHAYQYRYALPTDNIRLVQVYTQADYKVEGSFIITNSDNCQIKYVADIIDVNQWTSDFTALMAANLQAEIAYSITKDKELQRQFYKVFVDKLQAAIWADASEDTEDEIPTDANGLVGVRF
ncbi:hypothetical protein [Methylomonas koyamae]|uniref:hypothetical protein n=1 Tax=Methylomonas koyamae TaxID=702114 RepID=UPI0006CFD591|nr:hypothetical protein [Methylomonas koyamae]BBL57002.1 hypothetical protein MKFW12EY_06150 [Methylomonas koyamae]